MQRVDCNCVKVSVKYVQFVPLDTKVCCTLVSLCLHKLKPLRVESEVVLAAAHFCADWFNSAQILQNFVLNIVKAAQPNTCEPTLANL